MKKNTLIPVIVIILLLLSIGGYFLMNKPSTSVPNESGMLASSETAQDKTVMQKASLKSIMGMQNQECTFNDAESGSNGTMRVANGKMRGDFVSKNETQTLNTHMISDGKDAYIWMDELQSAMKISLTAMEDVNSKALANAPKTVDLNREVDYKCESWSPDNSLFQVPTDRTFTDMSAMMKDAAKMMEKVKPSGSESSVPDTASACAACEQVPAEAKAQCKAALNCK